MRAPPNGDKTTPVEMSLYLDEVTRIDVATHTYDVTAQLVLEWRDPRAVAAFPELEAGRPIEFDGEQVSKTLNNFWHPAVEINNEEGQRSVGVRSLDIYPDGRVKLYEKFDTVANLEGDMHLFPFATADLRLSFSAYHQDKAELELKPRRFEFKSGADAAEVIVGHWDFASMWSDEGEVRRSDEPDDAAAYAAADFVVRVRRDPGSSLSSFLLPPLLIVLVSLALLWLDAATHTSYCGPRIGGVITLILTTVALQLTLESKTPSVHYRTLLDNVYMGVIAMLTLNVALTVAYIAVFHTRSKAAAGVLDRRLKVGYPLVIVAVALAAFAAAAL